MVADAILKALKILIVDDEEANVLLLEKLLRREGYANIISTTDPRQALPIFQEFQPDLLLLDLMMPHLDGYAVMQQLRPLTPPATSCRSWSSPPTSRHKPNAGRWPTARPIF